MSIMNKKTLSTEKQKIADVNQDNKITIVDYIRIMKIIMKK